MQAKHEENMHALQQQIRRSKDEADRLASENQAHIALLTEGQRQAQHLHEEEIRLQVSTKCVFASGGRPWVTVCKPQHSSSA